VKRVLSHRDPRNDGERGRSVRASNQKSWSKRIERFEHTDERWLIAERVSRD
jgi:hypothetical protein